MEIPVCHPAFSGKVGGLIDRASGDTDVSSLSPEEHNQRIVTGSQIDSPSKEERPRARVEERRQAVGLWGAMNHCAKPRPSLVAAQRIALAPMVCAPRCRDK